MKKSFLLSITGITLVALTATTLYAQTTTGNSVISRMKAAVSTFTLTGDLNPGQTGLQSAPVSGKKTGDILTAGEWNRVLELVSEGGGGSGWVDVPLSGAENFDDKCLYRFQIQNPGRQPYVGATPYFFPNGVAPTQLTWWLGTFSPEETWHIAASSKTVLRMNGAAYTAGGNITKIEKLCGGGGSSSGSPAFYRCTNAQSLDPTNAPCYGASRNGGAGTNQYRVVSCSNTDASGTYTAGGLLNFGNFITNKWSFHINNSHIACTDGSVLVVDTQSSGGNSPSGWSDVPLAGTTPFEKTCEYRFHLNAAGIDGVYYANGVHAGGIIYISHNQTSHINADSKTIYRVDGVAYYTNVSKIEKRCN